MAVYHIIWRIISIVMKYFYNKNVRIFFIDRLNVTQPPTQETSLQ